jgi:integrase
MSVRKFFDFLLHEKLVGSNPTSGIMPLHLFSDVIPSEKLTGMHEYLALHQSSDDPAAALRYRRDELVFICLALCGIRITQIPDLRISNITQTDDQIRLRVTEKFWVDLHAAFLIKLREYLTLRRSRVDIIFVEPNTRRPVSSKSLHALCVELSCACHVHCTPASLYHTYRYLLTAPGELQQIWQSTSKTAAAVSGQSVQTLPSSVGGAEVPIQH